MSDGRVRRRNARVAARPLGGWGCAIAVVKSAHTERATVITHRLKGNGILSGLIRFPSREPSSSSYVMVRIRVLCLLAYLHWRARPPCGQQRCSRPARSRCTSAATAAGPTGLALSPATSRRPPASATPTRLRACCYARHAPRLRLRQSEKIRFPQFIALRKSEGVALSLAKPVSDGAWFDTGL